MASGSDRISGGGGPPPVFGPARLGPVTLKLLAKVFTDEGMCIQTPAVMRIFSGKESSPP